MISWSSLDKSDKRPILLFGVLTIWTPCGLALAAVSLANGAQREWPPDDLRESIGFWSSIAIFVTLFVVTLWTAGVQALRYQGRTDVRPVPLATEKPDSGDER